MILSLFILLIAVGFAFFFLNLFNRTSLFGVLSLTIFVVLGIESNFLTRTAALEVNNSLRVVTYSLPPQTVFSYIFYGLSLLSMVFVFSDFFGRNSL